jgi:hypothetical protein
VGQFPIVAVGLVLAAWGQLLLREEPRFVTAWIRMDSLFPPALQSSPTFAGYALLGMGAALALMPILG